MIRTLLVAIVGFMSGVSHYLEKLVYSLLPFVDSSVDQESLQCAPLEELDARTDGNCTTQPESTNNTPLNDVMD